MKKRNLRAKTSKIIATILCTLLCLGALSACQGKVEVKEINLNYGISNAWDSLMPYNSVSGSNYSRIVYDKIYDRLCFVRADGSCLPRAAKSWESVDEGRGIVFSLDERAAFHDGTPVTAQHWEETIRLMTDPACPTLGRGAFAGIVGTDQNGARLSEALGVEVLDEYTLQINFKSPQIPEEFLIAKNREFYVLPTHLMEGVAPEDIMDLPLWKAPIGSGPMRFLSEISGSMLTLESNTDYPLGAPGFGYMTIMVIDKANQLTALIAGDLDYFAFGNSISEESASIAQNAGLSLIEGEIPTTFYELMLNNESIAEKELRQAIELALDKPMLAKQNNGDLSIPAASSLLPGSAGAAHLSPVERDIERAKQLVEEHYDGRELILGCTAQRETLAALIQQNLQEAGLRVTIMTVDASTLFSGMYDGEFDLAVASHTPSVLPLWFVESRFREDSNLFRVPEVSGYLARIEAVQRTVDAAAREQVTAELEDYLRAELPFIPLWFASSLYAESKTVSGIDYPASSFSNENVWDWKMK